MSLQRVDYRAFGLRCLGQIPQETDNTLHVLPFLFVAFVAYPSQKFTQDYQVDDDASCQQTVLADIVADKGMLPTHVDLTDILVYGFLGVSCTWDVLDDDCVVWRLFLGVHIGVVEQVEDAF